MFLASRKNSVKSPRKRFRGLFVWWGWTHRWNSWFAGMKCTGETTEQAEKMAPQREKLYSIVMKGAPSCGVETHRRNGRESGRDGTAARKAFDLRGVVPRKCARFGGVFFPARRTRCALCCLYAKRSPALRRGPSVIPTSALRCPASTVPPAARRFFRCSR